MEDTKQTKSTKNERPGGSNFKPGCCNFDNMAQMMQKFCEGKEGTFDCCAMMKKMCGTASRESDKA